MTDERFAECRAIFRALALEHTDAGTDSLLRLFENEVGAADALATLARIIAHEEATHARIVAHEEATHARIVAHEEATHARIVAHEERVAHEAHQEERLHAQAGEDPLTGRFEGDIIVPLTGDRGRRYAEMTLDDIARRQYLTTQPDHRPRDPRREANHWAAWRALLRPGQTLGACRHEHAKRISTEADDAE